MLIQLVTCVDVRPAWTSYNVVDVTTRGVYKATDVVMDQTLTDQ